MIQQQFENSPLAGQNPIVTDAFSEMNGTAAKALLNYFDAISVGDYGAAYNH